MRRLLLEIEGAELPAVTRLIGRSQISFGQWVSGPHGMMMWLGSSVRTRGHNSRAAVLAVVLSIPATVSANMITDWLLHAFPHEGGRIRIERTEVVFERGHIARIIEEALDQQDVPNSSASRRHAALLLQAVADDALSAEEAIKLWPFSKDEDTKLSAQALHTLRQLAADEEIGTNDPRHATARRAELRQLAEALESAKP